LFDTWGKFPPKGILEGTVTDFGDYDQCLAIEPNEVIRESQYCLIDIKRDRELSSHFFNFS
jgi:hypothetical protein